MISRAVPVTGLRLTRPPKTSPLAQRCDTLGRGIKPRRWGDRIGETWRHSRAGRRPLARQANKARVLAGCQVLLCLSPPHLADFGPSLERGAGLAVDSGHRHVEVGLGRKEVPTGKAVAGSHQNGSFPEVSMGLPSCTHSGRMHHTHRRLSHAQPVTRSPSRAAQKRSQRHSGRGVMWGQPPSSTEGTRSSRQRQQGACGRGVCRANGSR